MNLTVERQKVGTVSEWKLQNSSSDAFYACIGRDTDGYGLFTKVADQGTVYGDFQSLAVGVRHNF